VLANPLRLAGANGVDATLARADAPALGEHTQAVLLEAGVTRDEIVALQSEGAIS
jgi:crotonobetainyl-CoA:carnitine CoA-transferase CaiB-like acyl-CoA transferase